VARWKKAGVDVDALKKCLGTLCGPGRPREMPMAAKRVVKTGARKTAAKSAAAQGARPDSVFRQATRPAPVPRPARLDAETRRKRAAMATKHFHRDPFPTLVEGDHPHGPGDDGSGGDPHGGDDHRGHEGHDHGGHDHGGPDRSRRVRQSPPTPGRKRKK
jgi:hypothetical protein